jgi:L-lactate dehydrogenase complex protein LldF
MKGSKRRLMWLAGAVLKRPRLYSLAGRVARTALRVSPRWLVYNRLNRWGRQRELPVPPKQSFRDWYRDQQR